MMFFAACSYTFFWLLFNSIRATKAKCVGGCTSELDPLDSLQVCTQSNQAYPCLGCVGRECSPNNELFYEEPEKELDYNRLYLPLYCDSKDTTAAEALKAFFERCDVLIQPNSDLTQVGPAGYGYWNYEAYGVCAFRTVFSLDARKSIQEDYDNIDLTNESPCINEITRCKRGPAFDNPLTIGLTVAVACMAGLALVIYCRFRPRASVEDLPVINAPPTAALYADEL